MDDITAFRIYLACRLHFVSGYDYIRYSGRLLNSVSTIEKRSDVQLVKALRRMAEDSPREILRICVANHLYGNPNFLYDQTYTVNNYKKHVRIRESIGFYLERDLSRIELSSAKYSDGIVGYLNNDVLNDLFSSKLEYETLSIIGFHVPMLHHVKGFESETICNRLTKASSFLCYGDDVIARQKSIIKTSFLQKEDENVTTK